MKSNHYLKQANAACLAKAQKGLNKFAQKQNISKAKASNLAAIGECTEGLKQFFETHNTSYSTALEIANMSGNEGQKLKMAQTAFELNLPVRSLRDRIKDSDINVNQKSQDLVNRISESLTNNQSIHRVEENLTQLLQCPASIYHFENDSGFIKLDYRSLDELGALLDQLTGKASKSP